jgi:hypothetical protein
MFILLVALVVLGIVFVFALFIILAVFCSPYDYLPNEEVDELYNYYSEYFSNLTHSNVNLERFIDKYFYFDDSIEISDKLDVELLIKIWLEDLQAYYLSMPPISLTQNSWFNPIFNKSFSPHYIHLSNLPDVVEKVIYLPCYYRFESKNADSKKPIYGSGYIFIIKGKMYTNIVWKEDSKIKFFPNDHPITQNNLN